jgi:hypothetical protein
MIRSWKHRSGSRAWKLNTELLDSGTIPYPLVGSNRKGAGSQRAAFWVDSDRSGRAPDHSGHLIHWQSTAPQIEPFGGWERLWTREYSLNGPKSAPGPYWPCGETRFPLSDFNPATVKCELLGSRPPADRGRTGGFLYCQVRCCRVHCIGARVMPLLDQSEDR